MLHGCGQAGSSCGCGRATRGCPIAHLCQRLSSRAFRSSLKPWILARSKPEVSGASDRDTLWPIAPIWQALVDRGSEKLTISGGAAQTEAHAALLQRQIVPARTALDRIGAGDYVSRRRRLALFRRIVGCVHAGSNPGMTLLLRWCRQRCVLCTGIEIDERETSPGPRRDQEAADLSPGGDRRRAARATAVSSRSSAPTARCCRAMPRVAWC